MRGCATRKHDTGFSSRPRRSRCLSSNSTSLKVVEANPAAAPTSQQDVEATDWEGVFGAVRRRRRKAGAGALGCSAVHWRADEVTAKLAGEKTECVVSASLFRQGAASHFLVRLFPCPAMPLRGQHRNCSASSRACPMASWLPTSTGVSSRPIPHSWIWCNWLPRSKPRGSHSTAGSAEPGVDVNALVTTIREHGAVQHFSTISVASTDPTRKSKSRPCRC